MIPGRALKWCLAWAALCLLWPSNALAQKVIDQTHLRALADTCIRLLQAEDFRGAALMYHYPPDYSADELEAELAGVAGSLKIFTEDFGQIGPVRFADPNDLFVTIYATGGTHAYWEQYPHAYKYTFKTEFSQYGPGYLVIQIVDILETLEVKAIAFGLPVSGRSVARIKQAGDKMVLLMDALSGGAAAE